MPRIFGEDNLKYTTIITKATDGNGEEDKRAQDEILVDYNEVFENEPPALQTVY